MSEDVIKPIPTRYKGYHFRSRLEARWAVFFDCLLLEWEYEPEGFNLGDAGLYLPDFKVKYPGRDKNERHYVWFEVKSDINKITENQWQKLLKFEKLIPHVVDEFAASYLGAYEYFIVLDGIPNAKMYNIPSNLYKKYRKSISSIQDNHSKGIDSYSGNEGVALWSHKGRLWWDNKDDFFDGGNDFGQFALLDAIDDARSARFEYGESGPT